VALGALDAPNATLGTSEGGLGDGIYEVTGRGDNRKLGFRSYYKIPRPQARYGW
jgi:hypothetical protein